MKLYKIIVLHGAPKDSHTSTETYLVKDNEQEVFDWIDSNQYGAWSDDDGEDPKTRYTDDGKEIPFKDWLMANKGDLTDEEGWEDAYYGVTKYGWKEIVATPDEIAVLVKLGIATT